jgi:hypothetical protein
LTISALVPAAEYLWRRRGNERSQAKRLR